MTTFLIFSSADPFLGRVDKGSLSQQTLMELLISGFTKNKEEICRDSKEMKDISEWQGVTLNDSNEVIKTSWTLKSLEGSLELQWLPLTVTDANFCFNSLSGTVDLTCLPDSLETLYLSYNKFEGTVDLTKLPYNISKIGINDNRFSGKTDFSHLPSSLVELYVSNTDLEGVVVEFGGSFEASATKVLDMRKK